MENKDLSRPISTLTVDDIARHCEKSGITVGTLCDKLQLLLNAKRNRYDRDGDIISEEEDNNVQLKALSVALELLKLVGNKTDIVVGTVQHQMAPGDISRLEMIAQELKGLETRLVTDKVQQGKPIDITNEAAIRE